MSKYEVEIIEKKGTMDNEIFETMAKNGDLTATKIAGIMETEVTITGYAECKITTEDKQFDILYINTKEYGIVSAGSEIFKESIKNYYGKVSNFRIKQIKTKKGNTYKAVPILNSEIKEESTKLKEKIENEELPF